MRCTSSCWSGRVKFDTLCATIQGELVVPCAICELPDREISCVGHIWVRECKECGYYGMPAALVEKLHNGQRLNTERTREFLTRRTQHQLPPWITLEDAEGHYLFE